MNRPTVLRNSAEPEIVIGIALKIFYNANDWVDNSTFLDRLDHEYDLIGKTRESRTGGQAVAKYKPAVYYGLLDVSNDGKSRRINEFGKRYYEAYNNKDQDEMVDCLISSICKHEFGRNNPAVPESHSRIEPPKVFLVSCLLLNNKLSKTEYAYIIENLANDKDYKKIIVEISLARLQGSELKISEYAKNMQKSMVTLTGITSRVDWFNDINESTNKSSGVIIYNNTKELLILTDYSALENAQRINVTFCNGATITAELQRKDPSTNLAVVSVPIDALPEDFLNNTIAIAKPGSSNHSNLVGTPVVALGNPMGYANSAGFGVITAASAQATDTDANYKLLQTDIVGSPMADGVLFNLYGQFIGIITHEHSSDGMENLIVAYGITDLKKRMEKLSNDQPFAYFGIYGTSVTLSAHEELTVPYGTYVKEVLLDSPAMRAGIQKGDVIIRMDEYDVNNFTDFVSFLYLRDPEETVRVTILRQAGTGYKEMTVVVDLEELR